MSEHDHGDHEHSHEHLSPEDLTAAVVQAQSGLRSSVQKLIDALQGAELFVPLSENIDGATDGEEMPLDGELSFRPHMLIHEDGSVFATGYTEPQLVDNLQQVMEWQTSGQELKFLQIASSVALDLGQSQVESTSVRGIVLNAGSEAELVLLREELASILQGNALPLIGYVEQLPEGSDEETQLIEDADPAPQALLDVLTAAVKKESALSEFEVLTTFNPERDREPHLSLVLVLESAAADRQSLADRVMAEAGPLLPAPGYCDILFRDKE